MPNIQKLPSGTYRVRIYLGTDDDGKRIVKSFTSKNKKELQRIAEEYAARNKDRTDRRAISKAMNAYIKVKTPVLSPASIKTYINLRRRLMENHPGFCKTTVDCVNRRNLQQLVADLALDGNSPKTIRNYMGLISGSMKYCGYQPPVVTLPQKIKPNFYVPDPDTMSAVIRFAAGTEMEIPIQLAVMGMRCGEICAAREEDLDGNMLHIHRNVVFDAEGQLVEKAPKTYESDRWIQLPTSLAARIHEQGFVTNLNPRQITNRFRRLLQRGGFPHFRFHDCRHFFVSYCHNVLKLSDAQIQKLGGWRTDHVMRSHYLTSMNDTRAGMKVANKMEKLISAG